MKLFTVLTVFSESAEKIGGADVSQVTVGGYGMRNALASLSFALRDFTIFDVSMSDSYISVSVPRTDEKDAFDAVCKEFSI